MKISDLQFSNFQISSQFFFILGPRWWLRGTMTKKIAEEIIHLLKDMSSGNVSSEWGDITKSAVAEAILNLTRIEEAHR